MARTVKKVEQEEQEKTVKAEAVYEFSTPRTPQKTLLTMDQMNNNIASLEARQAEFQTQIDDLKAMKAEAEALDV